MRATAKLESPWRWGLSRVKAHCTNKKTRDQTRDKRAVLVRRGLHSYGTVHTQSLYYTMTCQPVAVRGICRSLFTLIV